MKEEIIFEIGSVYREPLKIRGFSFGSGEKSLCIVGASVTLRNGRLADIAPTMLDLMGLERPEDMDGETLIIGG